MIKRIRLEAIRHSYQRGDPAHFWEEKMEIHHPVQPDPPVITPSQLMTELVPWAAPSLWDHGAAIPTFWMTSSTSLFPIVTTSPSSTCTPQNISRFLCVDVWLSAGFATPPNLATSANLINKLFIFWAERLIKMSGRTRPYTAPCNAPQMALLCTRGLAIYQRDRAGGAGKDQRRRDRGGRRQSR